MKLRVCFLLVLLAGKLAAAAPQYREGRLFFKVRDNSPVEILPFTSAEKNYKDAFFAEWITKYSVTSICKPFKTKAPSIQKIYEIRFDNTGATDALMSDIRKLEFIEYVERVQVYPLSFVPNDVHANQWYFNLIQAFQAWDISPGSAMVKVAVIDNAFHIAHSDLAGSVYVNPNEIAGNMTDDDNNGFIDDVNGFDVSDNDNDPEPPQNIFWQFGLWDHGTHCAGIAAAVTNNANGIASIGNGIKFIPVKTVGDANIPIAINDGAAGIDYAITAGADVISMSWGSPAQDQTITALLNYASSKGIVLVAAAGNDGTQTINYPAADSNVISVAALSRYDKMASFSQYGSTIDVVAPGDSIWSCVATPADYGYESGTSMACPMVAGLCALMLSYDTSFTPAMIESCLKAGCENIDAANPAYLNLIGAGRINALRSLTCMNPALGPLASYHNSIQAGACVDSLLYFYSNSINADSVSWTFQNGNPATSTSTAPQVSYTAAGTYAVQLIAKNAFGSDTLHSSITIYDPPLPSFTMSNDTVMANTGLALANTSANSTGQLWILGDGDSVNTAQVTHSYAQPGIYYITLVASNPGCSNRVTDSVVVIPNTSGIRSAEAASVSLYPNPANGQVTITAGNSRIESVEVYNELGQIIVSFGQQLSSSLVIDTKAFREGLYSVKVVSGGVSVVKKLSILK